VIPIPFDSILDPKTGKAQIRLVDIDSDSYRVARHYMIRLDESDFADPKTIGRYAVMGKMSPEEFEKRFRYLTNDPPAREPLSKARG
jgi:6-phosphofructokinase 1